MLRGMLATLVTAVIFGLRARLQGSTWPQMAEWKLGKYGVAINSIAVVYTSFISFVLIMPPNELAGKTLAGLIVILLLIYFMQTKKKFVAPQWALPVESKGQS